MHVLTREGSVLGEHVYVVLGERVVIIKVIYIYLHRSWVNIVPRRTIYRGWARYRGGHGAKHQLTRLIVKDRWRN